MGYIRKALSITTLGLSGLVLEDDSKRAAKAAPRTGRPQKPKTKARAKATAKAKADAKPTATAKVSAKPTAPTAVRSKPKPKRAKPKAAPKAARKPPTARAKSRAPAQHTPDVAPQPTSQAARYATGPKAPAPAPASGTVIALERMSKLHDQGALTDQEFAAAKARILGTSPLAPAPGGAHATFPAIEANVAAARRLEGLADPDRDASAATPGAVGGI